jgi:hypothetical protein
MSPQPVFKQSSNLERSLTLRLLSDVSVCSEVKQFFGIGTDRHTARPLIWIMKQGYLKLMIDLSWENRSGSKDKMPERLQKLTASVAMDASVEHTRLDRTLRDLCRMILVCFV